MKNFFTSAAKGMTEMYILGGIITAPILYSMINNTSANNYEGAIDLEILAISPLFLTLTSGLFRHLLGKIQSDNTSYGKTVGYLTAPLPIWAGALFVTQNMI